MEKNELEKTNKTDIVEIGDFQKIKLQVAEIIKAEKVENSDKLLRLEINLGTENRQIISGIAEFYQPENLIGKKIIIIANLKPRILRGLESQGMLLAASNSEKSSVSLLQPDGNIPNGSFVG